jgi:signal transduction histidine kinase
MLQLDIRTRLALQFAGSFGMLLLISFIGVYLASASYREAGVVNRLRDKATTTARLLINIDDVSTELLNIIDRNTVHDFHEEQVVVVNDSNRVIYNSLSGRELANLNISIVKKIRNGGEQKWRNGNLESIGIPYSFMNKHYVVVSRGFDYYGLAKLNNLKLILVISYILGLGLSLLIAWIYAGRALKPMQDVVVQVENISISSLNLRVDEGNGKDEIAQLAATFNQMLDRLEQAFLMQKSFVSHASHELRTPLTSIRGQLEVALMGDRSIEQYQAVLESIREDILNLTQLCNGLLTLARAESDFANVNLTRLRFDDVVWQARDELLKASPNYKIEFAFTQEPLEDDRLWVKGSEALLRSAVLNLMDNGCKYCPEKRCRASISADKDNLILEVFDFGMGIHPEDLPHVFEPFYRSKAVSHLVGSGIGLPLAFRIVQLHGGTLTVQSTLGRGTQVRMSIPSLM